MPVLRSVVQHCLPDAEQLELRPNERVIGATYIPERRRRRGDVGQNEVPGIDPGRWEILLEVEAP